MNTMTKQDIIAKMAEGADITKAAAEKAFNTFTDTVTSALANRDKVAIIGFGTFDTSERAARTGRNPQTGAEMQIPASVVAKFKAGKKLKDAVAGKE